MRGGRAETLRGGIGGGEGAEREMRGGGLSVQKGLGYTSGALDDGSMRPV